jgi:amidophosphoribosyltransferase
MCGIVGIYSHEPVAAELHDSLIHLQHRGQDAAGVVTAEGSALHYQHGQGLVREIFTIADMEVLRGEIGIAHVRYPTAGGYSKADIQPVVSHKPFNIALAHNGNLTNHQALAEQMKEELRSSLDSEVLMRMLMSVIPRCARETHASDISNTGSALHAQDDSTFSFSRLCATLQHLYSEIKGSYSVVCLLPGQGLLAFRDPHGIRPLVWGERKRDDGRSDYIFASESTPFYALGFEPRGDLAAGEAAFVDMNGNMQRQIIAAKQFAPCVFEYVYFARPDSTLDGVSVYRSRLRMGQNLAKQWREVHPEIMPDIVIPVPFTANTSALSFAHELGVRYSEGLYKNPFIGRTFIMPNQKARSRSVRYKLTPQRTEIENKKVLIVDDSIVRGTTSREIVKMVREFGAKEIYFVSACPPVTHPCFYGIDMPSREELIAANTSVEKTRRYLGVDILLYQKKEDLVEAVTRRGTHQIQNPCMACLNGDYICGELTEEKIENLQKNRQQEKM